MKRTLTKTIGTKPFSGSRFVQDGKVRIEWWPGGKRKLMTIGPNSKAKRDEADQLLTESLAVARAIAEGKAPRPMITLGELLRRYGEDAAKRTTARTGLPLRRATLERYAEYAQVILAGFGAEKPAASLRRGEVKEFMRRMAGAGKGSGVIARTIEHLRQVYRWAVAEEELLEADPIAGVRAPSRKSKVPPYTREESRRLYEAILKRDVDALGRKKNDWRLRWVTLLTCVYGVRVMQACSLRWSDIDLDQVMLLEGAAYTGVITWKQERVGSKGQQDRTVPMVPAVRELLLHIHQHHRNGDIVAWGWQDPETEVTYDAVNRGIHRIERQASVRTIRGRAFHSLRRGIMTILVEEFGVNAAAALTGDSPVVIMRDYVRPSKEAMGQAMKAVEKAFPGTESRRIRDSNDGAETGREVSA